MVCARPHQAARPSYRQGVWPRHRGNLVQIERYLYFPADAGRFGHRWAGGCSRKGGSRGGRRREAQGAVSE